MSDVRLALPSGLQEDVLRGATAWQGFRLSRGISSLVLRKRRYEVDPCADQTFSGILSQSKGGRIMAEKAPTTLKAAEQAWLFIQGDYAAGHAYKKGELL